MSSSNAGRRPFEKAAAALDGRPRRTCFVCAGRTDGFSKCLRRALKAAAASAADGKIIRVFVRLGGEGAGSTAGLELLAALKGILGEFGLQYETEGGACGALLAPGFHRIALGRNLEAVIIAGIGGAHFLREFRHLIDELYCLSDRDAQDLRARLHVGSVIRLAEVPDDVGRTFLKSCERLDETTFRVRFGRPDIRPLAERPDVLIVGAGLSGAFAAHELAKRGARLAVVDANAVPAAGASALCAGIAHPHWEAADTPGFRLTREGIARLERLLRVHPEAAASSGGVIDLAATDEEEARFRTAQEEGRPFSLAGLARFITREEASNEVGLPVKHGGWFYEQGRTVRLSLLVRRIFEHSGAKLLMGMSVRLRRREALWEAVTKSGVAAGAAPQAVVAVGLATPAVVDQPVGFFEMSPLYGRLSLLRDTDLACLRRPLTGSGCIVRLSSGFVGVGATYERANGPVLTAREAHEKNLRALEKMFVDPQAVVAAGFYEGCRAVAKDRMPIAGPLLDAEAAAALLAEKKLLELEDFPVEPGLHALCALGSRGLSWGLAAAELLVSQMTGEEPLLPRSMARRLSPGRFLLKR